LLINERENDEPEQEADFEGWIFVVRDIGRAIAADCEQYSSIRPSLRIPELDRLNT